MIENAENYSEKFCDILLKSGFLGQKIYADFETQKNTQTNQFYIVNNAACMLSGTNLTLCGDITNEDIEEVISFCNFFAVKSIEAQILNLPLEIDKKLILMEYRGEDTPPCNDIIINESIYQFINHCCSCFEGVGFDQAYSNFTKKVNSKISQIYYIKENNVIISGAISTNYFDNTCYITFVATNDEYRNNGYAKKVIQHIVHENIDKKIILKCENKLVQFYNRLGFKAIDIITVFKGK